MPRAQARLRLFALLYALCVILCVYEGPHKEIIHLLTEYCAREISKHSNPLVAVDYQLKSRIHDPFPP